MLDKALQRLDPRHRAVVVLHYYLGMPLPEVAASLGIPVGTAKSRLHIARGDACVGAGRAGRGCGACRRRASGMTSERRLEQDLPDLLARMATGPTPDYRDHIVQQTARMRQRPAWTFPEGWIPMSAVTSRLATAPRFH